MFILFCDFLYRNLCYDSDSDNQSGDLENIFTYLFFLTFFNTNNFGLDSIEGEENPLLLIRSVIIYFSECLPVEGLYSETSVLI